MRMKSSLEKFRFSVSWRKFSDTWSQNACGATPAASADFSTFCAHTLGATQIEGKVWGSKKVGSESLT